MRTLSALVREGPVRVLGSRTGTLGPRAALGAAYPGRMSARRCLTTALALLLVSPLTWAEDAGKRERPAIDREEHANVKTATFALG